MAGVLASVILIVLIILGALYCFWGFRFLKIAIFIYAFFTTFGIVNGLLAQFEPQLGIGVFFIALVAGLIVALLSIFFVQFAIFIAGGIVGLLVYRAISAANPAVFSGMGEAQSIIVMLIFFVGLGILTLVFSKHLLIIFSAFFGGYTLVHFTGVLVGVLLNPEALQMTDLYNILDRTAQHSVFNNTEWWVMWVPVLVFVILGIVSQYRFTKGARRY